MNGPTKTQVILGCFLVNEDLRPEDVGISKSFFKHQEERLVFAELDGNRDVAIIADRIGSNIRDCHSYLSGLMGGIHKGGAAPERVRILVNEVKKERLSTNVLKKIDEGAKSGFFDREKIRKLYNEIDALDSD